MSLELELKERLEILYNAELIDLEVVDFCNQVIALLFKERNDYTQELLEVFVTHLAMATQRSRNGEIENGVESSIIESLRESENFDYVEKLMNQILSLTDTKFPNAEKQLLLIHLCNICSN